jgi:O-antigen/teichoic acid export membrane protein
MTPPIWFSCLPKFLKRRLDGRLSILAIVSNSGWLLLDKLLRLGLSVVVGIWVARYLGPSQFGELSYVLAYIVFFQAIANLGLDGIVVRDLSNDKLPASYLLGTAFILRLIVGSLCWISAIIFIGIINGWHDNGVLLTALVGSSLIFQSVDAIDLWFQSQSQSRRTVVAKISAYIISNSLKIYFVYIRAPLPAFALVIVIEGFLAAVGLFLSYKKYPCQVKWMPTKKIAYKLLQESWPFVLSGVSIVIYMRIDQIMIKEFIGIKKLGIYAAVLPLATVWQIIPVALNASLAPFVARKKLCSEEEYWLVLRKIFKFYALLGWVVCIPTILLSHWLVPILFGPSYQEGINVLSIYVFTNLFINMGMAQGLWMLNERKPMISLVNTMVGAVVCVIGNYFLIPHFGILGTSVVAVLSQLSSTMLTNLLFSKRIFLMQIQSLVWPFFKI